MRKSKKDVLEELRKSLEEIYRRSQEPVSTKDLWKSSNGNANVFEDYGLQGTNLSHRHFIKADLLEIVEDISPRIKVVVWKKEHGAPDISTAVKLYRVRNNMRLAKARGDEELDIEDINVEESLPDLSWGNNDLTVLIQGFLPEFQRFVPYEKTMKRLKKLLVVARFNASEKWCDKSKLFETVVWENGMPVTLRTNDGFPDFTANRLTEFQILKRNKKDGNQYMFVYQGDLDELVKQLSFYSAYNKNKGEYVKRRNQRIARERQEAEKQKQALLDEERALKAERQAEEKANRETQEEKQELVLTAQDVRETQKDTQENQDLYLEAIREENQKLRKYVKTVVGENDKLKQELVSATQNLKEMSGKLLEVIVELKNNGMLGNNDR